MGVLVSVTILRSTKGHSAIKTSLALLLIICSLIVILGAISNSGKVMYVPQLICVDSPIHYLFGQVMYFYILASFRVNFRFR